MKPLFHFLIKPLKETEVMKSSIIIVENLSVDLGETSVDRFSLVGEVIKTPSKNKIDVKEGDIVYYSGTLMESIEENGEKLIFVPSYQIKAKRG